MLYQLLEIKNHFNFKMYEHLEAKGVEESLDQNRICSVCYVSIQFNMLQMNTFLDSQHFLATDSKNFLKTDS